MRSLFFYYSLTWLWMGRVNSTLALLSVSESKEVESCGIVIIIRRKAVQCSCGDCGPRKDEVME